MEEENNKYVMLVERNSKGRIVKNEQYSLSDFSNMFGITAIGQPSVFERLFHWGEVKDRMNTGFCKAIFEKVSELVDKDDFGKKR